MLNLSLFWIHRVGEKVYTDPIDGLLLSSYCLAVEGGNPFSSSFLGAPWHFVHLDEDLIDFYEGLGLGFRDDQEDVDGGGENISQQK